MMTCDRLRREKTPAARTPVRSVIAPQRLQRKLSIGATNDPAEHEADRVADTIMRMPDEHVQRACTSCEEELQRKSEDGAVPGVPDGFHSRFASLRGGGEPLPDTARSFFEPRFGRDFARVRVHSGPEAGELARSVGARAFTVGESVVFGSGQYAPGTAAGRHLLAHELTHVAQQGSASDETVHRAQIGHVTPAAGGTGAHFEYELDAAIKTYSQLASFYGVTATAIAAANTRSSKALHLGDKIIVPANGLPSTGRPLGPGVPALIQKTDTHFVDLRWGAPAGSNRIGRLSRGTAVSSIGAALEVPSSSLLYPATGLIAEMVNLGLADATSVSGFVDTANVRATAAAVSATDVDLIARMIWGEQRGEGHNAMVAAAWIARNRYTSGWGSYSEIVTKRQFHGIVSATLAAAAIGADAALWVDAQKFAQDIVDGKGADPTGGYTFFGNGTTVLASMKACAAKNPAFKWATIPGTNFHYSNLDYTGC
jgi:hypothetical protein